MILYYDPKHIGPIVTKVIKIVSNKNVSVVKENNPSIEGVTDADYYVYVHDDSNWCLRINWSTFTNTEDFGFIQFNYKCPDMEPLPNMPKMCFGQYLKDSTPAISIQQGNPHVGKLIRKLNRKVMIQEIERKMTLLLLDKGKNR